MKELLVIFKTKNKPVLKKIKRNLNWYDPIKKEMLYFEGGQLSFEYKKDDYLEQRGEKNTFRMLPKVIDLKEKGFESVSDKKDILNWFESYLNYNDSGIEINEINEEGIIFNVLENELDDFTYQLERNNFNYKL